MFNRKIIVILVLQMLTAGCWRSSPWVGHETSAITSTPIATAFVSTAHQSWAGSDLLPPKILNSSTVKLPALTILSQSAISHLPMPDASWVFAAANFVYWTEYQRHDQIFRHPLEGGTTETVIRSLYDNGDVSLIRPKISGNWLIFVDAQASAENVPFLLRAVNLVDGSEQTLDGRWVYWNLTFGSAIYVYDLQTQQMYFVTGPNSGENLNILNMNGRVLVWWRDLTADDVIRDGNIEWATVP